MTTTPDQAQITTDEPAALATIEDGIGIITLNRPKAMNAVNAALSTAVGSALAAFDADPEVRAIIVTGTGRAFCAGADLKEIGAGRDVGAEGHPEWGFAGLVNHAVRTPVIAAVNGFALGGGSEIVLACDLVVLADTASLGLPEVKRGLIAAAGGVIRLPRQMPQKVAMEYALTGDPIPAAEALRWGLATSLAPVEDVLDTAKALARRITVNAPLAVAASKAIVRAASDEGSPYDETVWALSRSLQAEVFASDDAKEGPTAFAEKRQPVWTGR